MGKDPSIPEGISFSLSNPRAVAYLKEHGAEQIPGIDETTRATIRDILVRGRQEGWAYDKVAKAIIEQFPEFAVGTPYEHIRSRAHLIAVDETSKAYGEANYQVALGMDERGLPMEKKWAASPDEKTCEVCLGNAAVGWVPVRRPFPSGHQREPAHPACRCNTQYRWMGTGA
jgi:hypothetical protein